METQPRNSAQWVNRGHSLVSAVNTIVYLSYVEKGLVGHV